MFDWIFEAILKENLTNRFEAFSIVAAALTGIAGTLAAIFRFTK